MKLRKFRSMADDFFNISGSFGKLDTAISADGDKYRAEKNGVLVSGCEETEKNGITLLRATVKNNSEDAVSLHALSHIFNFEGGEYSVYTQSNTWQNESTGGWQPLISSVGVRCQSIRNAHGAAPFAVLFNEQTGRGVAFHILAYSAWQIRISRNHTGGEATHVEVEVGVLSDGLDYPLAVGEELELPTVICYEVRNKTDLDSWKLHSYLNRNYPRRSLPIIFNTWLYKFDDFSFDDVLREVECAAKIGVEYFVIDAGWFGVGAGWWSSRGDWVENPDIGFKGRMLEFANAVRAHGMKFGFWLEPESASGSSIAVAEHPEYFLKGKKAAS